MDHGGSRLDPRVDRAGAGRPGALLAVAGIAVVAVAGFATLRLNEPATPSEHAPVPSAAGAMSEEAGGAPPAADSTTLDPAGEDEAPASIVDSAPITEADLAFVAGGEAARRVAKPDAVRGIYLNAWTAGSSRRMAALMDLADRTELNSFVIDVKDATGYVSYRSGVPLVSRIGADRELRVRDVRRLLEDLRARGIYPIARIVVFKDKLLAERRPDLAVQTADGRVWVDHNGEVWIDPYNRTVWDYNIALAREAAALGFSEIQWDYVRFPDVPWRYMKEGVFPAQEGRTRENAIREFLLYSRERLADLGVPVTADVFGLTTSAGDDMGIGQRWSRMVDATDVLLPMVYPSHYARGSYGIAHPNGDPYGTVRVALDWAVRRSSGVEGAAAVRPWLQDFTLGQPRYGPAHVRAQIEATYDAGLSEWILWNPGSRYTAEALAPANGSAPRFPRPRPAPQDAEAGPAQPPLERTERGNRLLGDTVRAGRR